MKSDGFNLSAWGLRHGALVAFAMLLSLLLGALAYVQLDRAEDPDLSIKVMTIDVAWVGAGTRDLEQQVVEKIQCTLQEVPHFDDVQSHVRPGQATTFLVLHDATRKAQIEESGYQARKRVGDILHTLPAGIRIEKIVDQPNLAKRSVNEFLGHFVLGVSLMALGLRTGLVVALSVPLVLGATTAAFVLALVAFQ